MQPLKYKIYVATEKYFLNFGETSYMFTLPYNYAVKHICETETRLFLQRQVKF